MRLIALVLLLVSIGLGQTGQFSTIKFTAPAPSPISLGSLSANVIGTPGSTTYYYWVVANYPIGQSNLAGPVIVTTANTTLSGTNYVQINFNPNGATSYAVLRTTTNVAPTNGTATNAVITNSTGSPVNDQSNSLISFTLNIKIDISTNLILDNQSYAYPQLVSRSIPILTVPNVSIVASLSTVNPIVGTLVEVSDGLNNNDCIYGGGATNVICKWTGTSWQSITSNPSNVSVFSTLITQLNNNQSTGYEVISDSTTDAVTEWSGLFATWLGTLYPNYNVYWRGWDDTTSTFLFPVTLQSSPLGLLSVNFTGTGSSVLDSNYIVNPTTDIDLRVNTALASWTPASRQTLFNHGNSTPGNHGIFFWVNSTGGGLALCWQWSADGTTDLFKCSNAVPPNPGAGVSQWVRVTHTLDNGAGGNDVKFYTSSNGSTWTQLGTTQTSAGTTSYSTPNGVNWEIGGTATSNGMTGSIYTVQLWQVGKITNPQPISIWFNELVQRAGITLTGGPELNVVNAAKSGADVAYWIDSTRGPKSLPNYTQATIIIPLIHNDGSNINGTFLTNYNTLISNATTALPFANVILGTENPRGPIISNAWNMSVRRLNIMSWGPIHGYPIVDSYAQFLLNPNWLADYTNSDGIHPNVAGELVLLKAYQNYFLNTR